MAPTNSVSPVSTNQGSSPRRLSVTSSETLSGVWPGVCSTPTMTLPASMTWLSRSGSNENFTRPGIALVQAV